LTATKMELADIECLPFHL